MIALALSTILLTSHGPHWIDRLLAGYALASDESHRDVGVYDPETGFYLTRSLECDGADITLTLTRDRKEIYGAGYRVPGYIPKQEGIMDATRDDGRQTLKVRKLAPLSTGKGIHIGDSPVHLRQVLGAPTHIKTEGSRHQFRVYSYEWTTKERDYSTTYLESYTFKAGRLIEIVFFQGGG